MNAKNFNLRYGVIFLVAIAFIFLINVNVVSASPQIYYANISQNCPVLTPSCPSLNYAVVGGTYDIWVFGNDLPDVNYSFDGFTLVSRSNDGSMAHYIFVAPMSINTSHINMTFGIYKVPVWSTIGEFFNSTHLNLTVTENSSQAAFYMNLAGTSLDNFNITNDGTLLTYKISNLLNQLNAQVNINKGWNYPYFTKFNITKPSDPNSLSYVYNLMKFGLKNDTLLNDLTGNLDFLNNYIKDHSSKINSPANIEFTKQDNNYILNYGEGYGSVSSDLMNEIRNIINQSLISMNIKSVANQVIPNVGGVNLSFLNSVNLNYTVGIINLSNVKLVDGNYTVAVFITDPQGDTLTKTINLHLEGLTNVETGNTINGGTEYSPMLPEINYILKEIKGLNGKIKQMKIAAFDTVNIPTPSGLSKVYKFFNISIINGSESNGTFVFTVNSANPGRVHLWVMYNGENNWTELNTTYNSSTGEYYASPKEFCLFMIAEDAAPSTPSSSSGGGGGGSGSWQSPQNVTIPSIFVNPLNYTNVNNNGNSINLTGNNNPQNSNAGVGITGAVIGALSSPTGIVVVIILAIGIISLGIIIVLKNRKSKVVTTKKMEKTGLNSAGDGLGGA